MHVSHFFRLGMLGYEDMGCTIHLMLTNNVQGSTLHVSLTLSIWPAMIVDGQGNLVTFIYIIGLRCVDISTNASISFVSVL